MLQVARSWVSFGSPSPPFKEAENDTLVSTSGAVGVQVRTGRIFAGSAEEGIECDTQVQNTGQLNKKVKEI